jgi:hypothetical protein
MEEYWSGMLHQAAFGESAPLNCDKCGEGLLAADPTSFHIVDEVTSQASTDVHSIAIDGENGLQVSSYLDLCCSFSRQSDVQVCSMFQDMIIGKARSSHHSYNVIGA